MSRNNNTYEALATCYDDMTPDVNYPAWADFIQKLFAHAGLSPHTVLDLACGTGTLSFLMAQRGYEMIGVDFSPEMLAVAAEKSVQGDAIAPIFLCQAMETLDLYGTVDACFCALDSVNHITKLQTLREAFRRVHLFLEPGGLFVFDILTFEHLSGLDGGTFLDETEDAYCVWRTDFDARHRICTYGMDLFRREGTVWHRESEEHRERAYLEDEIIQCLEKAGFVDIRRYGDLKLRPPRKEDSRIFFTARKRKQI